MTGCALLTSEGCCKVAGGESGSLVSTLCCQPDSSRLSLSPSALFLTTATGVWFVTSIWLQLSPLTLHSTTHAHTAAATTHAHTQSHAHTRARSVSMWPRCVLLLYLSGCPTCVPGPVLSLGARSGKAPPQGK